jgi:8-oxo-dGTP pyrophosphatase MutT (NUDIX family)
MSELSLTVAGGPEDALGDILFIHGLGGSGADTWTSDGTLKEGEAKQEFASFFPAVLSADFPDLRFLVLDYSAEVTKWSENLRWNGLHRVSFAVLEYLIGRDIGERPLVIVAHSLGGIVAKEILRTSSSSVTPRKRKFFESVQAVSFLATPHKGSNWADVLKAIESVLPFMRLTTRIEELKFDSSYLETLSKWYRENALPSSIETQAFYEQRPTHGLLIVDHVSANPDVSGCDPIPVSQNHLNICKPATKLATVYVCISGLIRFHLLSENRRSRGNKDPKVALPPQTIVIGIVKREGKVLMVRRRHMIDRLTWQFVAGRQKVYQEEASECIVREIREETGVSVRATLELGALTDQHAPFRRIYFACEYLSGEGINADQQENSDVAWVEIDRVESYITTPLADVVRQYLNL